MKSSQSGGGGDIRQVLLGFGTGLALQTIDSMLFITLVSSKKQLLCYRRADDLFFYATRSLCEGREWEVEERGGLPFVQAACVLVSRPSAHTGCGLFLNRLLLSFSIAGLSPRFWQWVDRQSGFSLLCFVLFCVFIGILVRNWKCLSQALFKRYHFNPETPLFEITVLGRKSNLLEDKE